jgi:hypothetical protein
MRALYGSTVALSLWAVSSLPAWSWGLDGHRTVGMVSDRVLQNSPVTRNAVNQILNDGTTLSEAATFADCAKGICGRPLSPDEQAYVDANRDHKTYHYTDVPIQQSQYRLGTAGTRDNDVVQIIK